MAHWKNPGLTRDNAWINCSFEEQILMTYQNHSMQALLLLLTFTLNDLGDLGDLARGRTLMQSSCAKCPAFFGSVPAKSSPPARPAKVQSPQAALGVSRCFKQQESTKALQILWMCSQKTTKMHVSTPKPKREVLRDGRLLRHGQRDPGVDRNKI